LTLPFLCWNDKDFYNFPYRHTGRDTEIPIVSQHSFEGEQDDVLQVVNTTHLSVHRWHDVCGQRIWCQIRFLTTTT